MSTCQPRPKKSDLSHQTNKTPAKRTKGVQQVGLPSGSVEKKEQVSPCQPLFALCGGGNSLDRRKAARVPLFKKTVRLYPGKGITTRIPKRSKERQPTNRMTDMHIRQKNRFSILGFQA